MKVLVSDPISYVGVEVLRKSPALKVIFQTNLTEPQLLKEIEDVSALIVRSQTKVTAKVIEAARSLRVIGRAGVGVDNVDVDAATQRGIIVLNTPGGNSISAAEHAVSMMLSLARNIPQAHASMKASKWDRKSFQGVELNEKTLGIIGMGRIGTEVARRGVGLGMRVLAYDPYLTASRTATLQVESVDLSTLCAQSDFITIHIPFSNETRWMIDKKRIEQMKRGVRIINCARGGIINEKDLYDGIKSGQVAGAALDVFEEEPPPADFPLRTLDAVIMTPHLGASTAEAQERVGIEIAHAVHDFLTTGTIRNAVNAANLDIKTVEALRPYLTMGNQLGRLLAQLLPGKIERLHISYQGKAAELQTGPISRAALKGFLECYTQMVVKDSGLDAGQKVNEINAPAIAKQLGIRFEESKAMQSVDYTEVINIEASVSTAARPFSVTGTFFGSPNNPRVIRINDLSVEAVPSGVLLILTNKDRPGVVGEIGTLLGRYKVNIASMSLSRNTVGGEALTVLNLDSIPPREAVIEIQRDRDIHDVKIVSL